MKITKPGRMPRVETGPIGFCIYCSNTKVELTTEHPVPYGLGGNHELLESVCTKCQRIINEEFEGYCLGVMFKPVRTRLGMPSRSKEKLVYDVDLIHADGSRETIKNVPLEGHPTALIIPKIGQPSLLTGDTPQPTTKFQPWFLVEEDIDEKVRQLGGAAAKFGSFDVNKFCRMIAKIAHGSALGALGWSPACAPPGFEPLLLDFILGKEAARFDLIGSKMEDEPPFPPNIPHFIEINHQTINGQEHLVVDVRLFAWLGAPRYQAIVARRKT
jgi:hypothetical protein